MAVIYIVTEGSYEMYGIEAVFLSLDEAIKFCSNKGWEYKVVDSDNAAYSENAHIEKWKTGVPLNFSKKGET